MSGRVKQNQQAGRGAILTVTAATSTLGILLGAAPCRSILLGLLVVVVPFLSGCGEDGIISRFMLKSDRIIVERRPDPAPSTAPVSASAAGFAMSIGWRFRVTSFSTRAI
jgi:hypothetical protein